LRLLLGHNSMNIRLLIDVSSFYLCIVSLPWRMVNLIVIVSTSLLYS
jgi:hypothetical protein